MNPLMLQEILALRLLVARAAASESLGWWEDESLTDAGLALAGRIFTRRPELIVQRLALRAAKARHRAALARYRGAIHLFDLRGEIEVALTAALPTLKIDIPRPIDSPDAFAQALSDIGVDTSGAPSTRAGSSAVQIEVDDTADPLAISQRLAAGYLLGEPGQPVFPFALPSTEARR